MSMTFCTHLPPVALIAAANRAVLRFRAGEIHLVPGLSLEGALPGVGNAGRTLSVKTRKNQSRAARPSWPPRPSPEAVNRGPLWIVEGAQLSVCNDEHRLLCFGPSTSSASLATSKNNCGCGQRKCGGRR